jgi:transcriptional regulator with XRE-family HTH domain
MALYRSFVTEPKGIPSSLADRISTAIRKAGFASHEEFAHVVNLPKSTLSRILSGKADPRLSTLNRIADGLEMSLVSLLEGDEGKAIPRRRPGRPSNQAITMTISVPPGTQAEDWFRLAAEECKALRTQG